MKTNVFLASFKTILISLP